MLTMERPELWGGGSPPYIYEPKSSIEILQSLFQCRIHTLTIPYIIIWWINPQGLISSIIKKGVSRVTS